MLTPAETTRTRLIKTWIKEACVANGKSKLANKIKWKWSYRMHSCGGEADVKKKIIILSRILYNRATLEQRKWLVVHETCHIIAGSGTQHHGREWKRAMYKAKAKIERCHSIPTTYEARCECYNKNHTLSFNQIKPLKNGRHLTCSYCNTYLKFDLDLEYLFW